MTAGRKLGPRATKNNGTGSVRCVFRPTPMQNALPNSWPKLLGEDARAISSSGLGEDLRRFAHRAFSLKLARTHRIHHRGHARWPTNTADAFDTRYGGKLVAPRRLPGKNGAPKVKLASARSGTMDCHKQFSSEQGRVYNPNDSSKAQSNSG